jgi:hypothetical protein
VELTKSDFLEWKKQDVTTLFFRVLQDRLSVTIDYLSYNAGKDQYEDAKLSGYIQACRDVLNTSFEEVNNDN